MVEFDHLPPTSRSLILTTLALEIASKNCKNIVELAQRRNQSIQDIWRDVCRKTEQPRCSMPRSVLDSNYSPPADAVALGRNAAPTPTSTASVPTTAPQSMKSVTAPRESTAAPKPAISKATTATAASAARTPAAAPPRGHRRQYILLAGVAAVLLLAIGTVVVVATLRPTQAVTATRPNEAIHVGTARTDAAARTTGAKTSQDAASVPAPQGTVRRMDAISKSFSKQ